MHRFFLLFLPSVYISRDLAPLGLSLVSLVFTSLTLQINLFLLLPQWLVHQPLQPKVLERELLFSGDTVPTVFA